MNKLQQKEQTTKNAEALGVVYPSKTTATSINFDCSPKANFTKLECLFLQKLLERQ